MTKLTLSQYQSVRDEVGVVDLSDRAKVKLSGADRVDFLHVMISNEVRRLAELHGRYGTLLTPTGKLVADFYYYRFADHLLIDVAAQLASELISTLEKHIIMDDATLVDMTSEWTHFALEGPKASGTARALFGVEPPAVAYDMGAITWEGGSGWLIRKNQLSSDGLEILLPRSLDARFRARLGGLAMVGPEAYSSLRIEAGVPIFGVDFDHSNNPLEAGLTEAISLDKGCYTGQEVISKATYVGGVSRRLVRLRLASESAVPAKAEVQSDDGKKIGHVTSAAVSPRHGATIAFAYVRRDWVEPGQRVVVLGAKGEHLPAEVWKP